jgi:hypothetical protein
MELRRKYKQKSLALFFIAAMAEVRRLFIDPPVSFPAVQQSAMDYKI